MQTHDDLIEALMRRPGVRTEVERLEREEFALLDLLLKARHEAGFPRLRLQSAWEPRPPPLLAWNGRWRLADTRLPWPPYANMPAPVVSVSSSISRTRRNQC